MGAKDVERQQLNVFRMKIMNSVVHNVESGSKTVKDAINEALRDWISNVTDTQYLIGSVMGLHPFPTMVRDFQSVIGKEIKKQVNNLTNSLSDAVIAFVRGGSNVMGTFYPFLEDKKVRLVATIEGPRLSIQISILLRTFSKKRIP